MVNIIGAQFEVPVYQGLNHGDHSGWQARLECNRSNVNMHEQGWRASKETVSRRYTSGAHLGVKVLGYETLQG